MIRVNRSIVTVLAIVILVTGIVLGTAIAGYTPRVQSQTFVDDVEAMFQRVYADASPSVVSITVRVPAGANVSPFLPFATPQPGGTGQSGQYQYAEGSGFVYDTAGHIITNEHVVDQADRVTVQFIDGTRFDVKVVGVVKDSDLAVLQYDTSKVSVKPLPLADSSKVTVGTRAIAIGNPFGLQGSMTQGIISAIGRRLLQQSQFNIPMILQTDAAINPGNSGGPLLNTKGEVVGVTTAIRSQAGQSSGIGFAIPSNIVKLMADQIIAGGKVEISYLGIEGTDMTSQIAPLMNLDGKTRGALVTRVVAGGPADKGGVRAGTKTATIEEVDITVGGDVITAVDGQPVNQFDDLLNYLFVQTKPDQKIKLTVLRDGQSTDIEVTLGKRPTSAR